MDFDLSQEAQAIDEVAREVLADQPDGGALPEEVSGRDWIDSHTYRALGEAGIIGAVLPESVGGAGLSVLDYFPALQALGRSAANVPMWESIFLAALPIARYGSCELQERFLPRVVSGESVLTGGFIEPEGRDLYRPSTKATQQGGLWRIDGRKSQVPVVDLADRIVISAGTPDGPILALIDPQSAGVDAQLQPNVTSRPLYQVDFDGVSVDEEDIIAGPQDSEALRELLHFAQVGLAIIASGVAWGALRLASVYTSQRYQFGRPISSFQAVGQRLADAYIDADAITMTAIQAAWALTSTSSMTPRTDVTDAVETASWWAAHGGHRVVHAAHHVHGGMGVDLEYPMHRYFRLAKYIEFTFGSASRQLARVGARLT